MKTETMHRNYKGVAKEPVLHVIHENGKYEELKASKATAWLKKLDKNTRLITTAAHSTDEMLLTLAEQGVNIYTAHWHSTGIEKGLEPKEIALAFSKLPDNLLREYVPRPDLRELRSKITGRNAVLEYRKAVKNQLGAAARYLGVAETKLPDWLTELDDQVETDRKAVEPKIDRQIKKLAEEIPDCRIFNRVFGMKEGWIVAGQFVSCVGDMSRFPTVASLWHYLGQHVVDGHAPKRARGAAMDWNPEARTTLWKTIDAGLKNNVPTIRNLYEEFKAQELAVHDVKHPGCETKLGHCGARARRRVTKELLKEYYALAGGQGRPQQEATA